MIRVFVSALVFLLLVALEFSFFNSLPLPFFSVPLIFACGLYFFQHLGSSVGLWWLLALGIYLDFYHLGLVFGETFIYGVTVLFVILLGRRLFTNRSFYGVVGNAVLSLWFLHLVQFTWFFIGTFNQDIPFPWWSTFIFVFWQTVFLFLLITILFFLARRVSLFFHRLLIVPNRENL
ncbi:MAG: hypothetical protein WC702_00645 [Patescibacteria group bacterium]|jgi:hypothetical protein